MTYIPIEQEPDVIQDMIDAAWDKYGEAIQTLANTDFRLYIKPWLEENDYKLSTDIDWGWSIEGDEVLDPDDLPKNIYNILSHEIIGMPTTDLGSLMPSYDPFDGGG